MSKYDFFSKGPSWWGEAFQSLMRCHDICQILEQFHVSSKTLSELSSLTSLKAWGDLEKLQRDVTFLLVLTKEGQWGTEYMAFPHADQTIFAIYKSKAVCHVYQKC